jgi:hypothetical protein
MRTPRAPQARQIPIARTNPRCAADRFGFGRRFAWMTVREILGGALNLVSAQKK